MEPGHLSRRHVLRGAAVAGISVAGLLLSGCSRLPFSAPARARRIGDFIFFPPSPPGSPPSAFTTDRVLAESLQALGRVEGRDFLIERRFAENQVDRLPVIAKELVDWPA